MDSKDNPKVGVIMGSKSDWPVMTHAAATLESLGVPHEVRVMSAHRTPEVVLDYSRTAEERGLGVIIAAAGGAAHLAGVVASPTGVKHVVGAPACAKAVEKLCISLCGAVHRKHPGAGSRSRSATVPAVDAIFAPCFA